MAWGDWKIPSFRETFEFQERTKGEIRQLFHPYYIINLCLAFSFLFVKLCSSGDSRWNRLPQLTRPICSLLFAVGPEQCELDMRETEILFFLAVVIMIRSRKTGNTGLVSYLAAGFMYAKCANLILFFLADPRLGLVYTLLFLLQGMLLPEPTYKGPENIVYFRGNTLSEELARDKNVVWMVTFFAAWSPACIDFTNIFAKLSNDYGLPNLKFGKVDVGRFADVAEEFHINTSSLSRQLPTLIMFQDGKELGRVPPIHNGKVQKFFFKEEDIITAFDLNNLYKKCKEDKKFVPNEAKEAKKDK